MKYTHAEQRRQKPQWSFFCGNAVLLAAILVLSTTTSIIRTADAFSTPPSLSVANSQKVSASRLYSARTAAVSSATATSSLRRELGSQENLMLPRQYGVNEDVTFPSMNHVSVAILATESAIPSEAALLHAISKTMEAHPLLRATIEGDGEPDERIDLFQMVRKGDNSPCTFVAKSDGKAAFSPMDVLRIVDVSSDTSDLEASWRRTFLSDLDDGSTWCDVSSGKTPLWKVELHKASDQAALVFSFNHAISDQNSASRLTDQILSLAEDFDSGSSSTAKTPSNQEIPPSVEESVLGRDQRFKDIEVGGFGLGTLKYVGGKALEETMAPVILPDDNKSEGGGLARALTTISGKAAGGDDETSLERKSVLAFRSLSEETTEKLLQKCRANGVSITNALSAALTLASTDFVGSGNKPRNYKILQSLDMRRFGATLDNGESVGCLAGSMDLMHGPLEDDSGTALLEGDDNKLADFWKLAKEGKTQTQEFIDSDGPVHAVRVFDFAMTISDLNNLVHLTAQSKDSQGRAYSAGFTNAGVYERLDAFEYEGEGREKMTVSV
jgi:hypothetical protein